MNNIKIYKYRRRSSSGTSEWCYKVFTGPISPSEVREYFQDKDSEYSWSEHHRGWELTKVKSLPREILAKKIEGVLSNIKAEKEYLKVLKSLK